MVERDVCAALWRAWRLQFLPTTLVVQVVQSVRYARLCVLNHTPAILRCLCQGREEICTLREESELILYPGF